MKYMERAPFTISAAIVAGSFALTAHLAIVPEPFASDSAALLATGVIMFALITAAGLLLSRGRWARRLGFAVVTGQLSLGLVVDLGAWEVITLGLNTLALAGLTGPWLRGWLRQRPAATGPGTRPVLLLLIGLALIPSVSIASPSGLHWQHWALAAVALLGALGYSRASGVALWVLRLAIVPVGALAAAASPPIGALYLAAHLTAVATMAWSNESLRAIRPLLDRAYGPRSPRPLDPRARDSA